MAMLEFIFAVCVPLVLVLIGLSAGTVTQRRHLASLRRRHAPVARIVVTDLRSFAPGTVNSPEPRILITEVVLAADYFKTFVTGLKKLIGGELRSYELLMRRARDEAIMRLKEAAQQGGYNALCNLRLETAEVGGSNQPGKARAAMVAIIASATAYRIDSPAAASSDPQAG